MPHAVIYGAGRIGMCLGCCLLSSGWRVTFVGRERLLNEIKENDNTLIFSDFRGGKCEYKYTGEKDDNFQFTTKLKAEDLDENDFILITVKRAQSEQVANELKELNLGKKVIIVSFQNGVDNKQIYVQHVPENVILTAIFGANVIKIDDEPHFRLATTNPAMIEYFSNESKILADALQKGKETNSPYVDCELHKEMESVVYGKLLLNLNNAVNALCGLPLQEELAERDVNLFFL